MSVSQANFVKQQWQTLQKARQQHQHEVQGNLEMHATSSALHAKPSGPAKPAMRSAETSKAIAIRSATGDATYHAVFASPNARPHLFPCAPLENPLGAAEVEADSAWGVACQISHVLGAGRERFSTPQTMRKWFRCCRSLFESQSVCANILENVTVVACEGLDSADLVGLRNSDQLLRKRQ